MGSHAGRDRQSSPQRYVVARPPVRDTSAVPRLVGVVDAALDLLRKSKASRGVPSNLAGHRGVLHRETTPAGERGEHQSGLLPQWPSSNDRRQERRQHVPRIGHVGALHRRVPDQLIAGDASRLAGVPDAPNVVEQGHVQPRPDVLVREIERAAQGRRQRGRAQRRASLEPESQVRQA